MELAAISLIAAAAVVYGVIRYLNKLPPAEGEMVLGKIKIHLLTTGELVEGDYSPVEKRWYDMQFVASMLKTGLTESQFKTLRSVCKLYAVKDEATRLPFDKTLVISTAPLGPESPCVQPIRAEPRLGLGRPVNVVVAAGYGMRLGTIEEKWNGALFVPLNLSTFKLEEPQFGNVSGSEFKSLCNTLFQTMVDSRRSKLNVSKVAESERFVEDVKTQNQNLLTENRGLADRLLLALKGASRPDLRQYPPQPEPPRRGVGPIWMYALALVGGYFAGSNFFAQNFASAQQAGFVGAIVAVVALYLIQRRKLI